MSQVHPGDAAPAGVRLLGLPDLAYVCEGLVIRDPHLPKDLVRALLDVAEALLAEAERRRRN